MKKIVNATNGAPPVGPYNHSTNFNGMIFLSGQIAINPENGELVTANIEDETHQVMKNIKSILDANGVGFENVLKCSIFVKDMANYERINAVYATYFDEKTAPARELVEVCTLPKNVNIEISTIACK